MDRIVNPFDPAERPTFLPGDKVRDRRDVTRRLWRIKSRVAYMDSELMSLEEVDNPGNRRDGVIAKDLIPYLEMAVPYAEYGGEAGANG